MTEFIAFADREQLVGRRIRALRGNPGITVGREYDVTGVWRSQERGSSQDGITVNVFPEPGGGFRAASPGWVHEYELLPRALEPLTVDGPTPPDSHLLGLQALNTVSAMLYSEAQSRAWCSEYDEFVQRVNAQLPEGYQLVARGQKWDCTWQEQYVVTVNRSMEVFDTDGDSAIAAALEIAGKATLDELVVGLAEHEFSRIVPGSQLHQAVTR